MNDQVILSVAKKNGGLEVTTLRGNEKNLAKRGTM